MHLAPPVISVPKGGKCSRKPVRKAQYSLGLSVTQQDAGFLKHMVTACDSGQGTTTSPKKKFTHPLVPIQSNFFFRGEGERRKKEKERKKKFNYLRLLEAF